MSTAHSQAAQTAVDAAYLAAFYTFSETDLSHLIAAPTVQLVASFLHSATQKAKEFEALKAQKLQADVELENAVRSSDVKQRAQKATLTRQAQEIEGLRTKVNEVESSRDGYVTQLSSLQSNALDSTNETSTLRNRIESLEHSNRDTLALIENHTAEKDRVHKELEQTHSKVVELRKDISKLEEQNRVLESQTSSQKFKEQSLKQQLDLLRSNNDRQAEDLRTTSAEHAKLRKERNARINALERERDDATALVDTLRQTETSLRQRQDDLQQKIETALTQNASLKEDNLRAEQLFESQIASTKRLAELHALNAATHKARLDELQLAIDAVRDDAAEEIARLQIDIEAERADKAQAEKVIADLELRVEEQQRTQHASIPSTPTTNGNLALATISNSAQKAVRSLTNTQVYANYVEVKQELEAEQRRNAKLQTTLDELLHELETRAPELLELRQEQDKLESEIVEFSRMLDDANETRDTAIRDSQKWQEEYSASVKTGDLLRQQLRDASAQVKILLVELRSKDQGLEDMTVEERLELERAARGQPAALENDTQQWISERLLIFRNVDELQSRNQDLLRVVRQLGDKMEGEEAQQKARQSAAYASENDELRKQVERYKDEMQATAVQIDSYMKERDMFRRMLQHRGTIAPDGDMQAMFGNSIMPATPQRNGIEPAATPRSKDVEDLNKLLKEQQKFFDQFREESAVDRRTLRDQADNLSKEKNDLQREVAHVTSQVGLANNRYELLQSNYNNLRNENVELQKRTQTHFEIAAKQDLRTQQVAEELVEAHSQIAALQNEKNNTKAERELWKRLEDRLTDDNKNLTDERSRLSKLNVDLSNLMNERERDASEARRRLQSQAEALETDLADMKRKLDSEIESGKKAVLRREYEDSQNRTRIDDLTKSLGLTREELAAAKTARDQLQTRVDELKIELRAAEEKATALQPRPNTRSNGETTTGPDALAPEQRLAIELSDAKRDLDFARAELDSAREQIEQYKTIAQSTEEELASFNQTSEQFREESDALVTEKDAAIRQLEQRIEDLSTELTATNAELSDLRTQHDNASQSLASQRASLEDELKRLKDDAERHDAEKVLYQEDLKAQSEIAQQAQQSYESELVKHADAARMLQSVRQELNDLNTDVKRLRAEATDAQSKLANGQDSWIKQESGLRREVTDLGRRRDDMAAQNDALHKQLETFSTELQALRQGRVSSSMAENDAAPTSDANLQEVITFLRREKEIIEVQHQLAVQEGQRAEQQLAYANQRIDELDAKLAEERKQHTDQASNEASTSKLAQAIDELNLFRESAVTLRNEARQARERYEEKSKELDRLHTELEPLQARVGDLEADIEVKDGEITLITADRDHWRDRTQNIISKYDRVDPAELEDLKTRTEALLAEKSTLEAAQVPLKEAVEAAEKTIADAATAANERLERFKEQAKQKARDQNAKISELKNELTSAQAEQTRLLTELDSANEKLTQATAKTDTIVEQTGLSDSEAEALRSRLAEADAQASVRTVEVETLQARINELEQQIEVLTSDLTAAQSANENVEEQGEVTEGDGAAEALARVQQELVNAQQEIARLQDGQVEGSAPESAEVGDASTQVERVRTEMQEQHELALKQVQDAADAKIAKMKSNLSRQLQEQRAQIQEEARAALIQEHSVELQKVRDDSEQQIRNLQEVHAAELARLKKESQAAVDRIPSNTTVGSSVGEGATNSPEITDEYVNDLMKNHARVRTVMQNSVRKTVAKETEKLSQALAAKDTEIAKLKETSTANVTSEDNGGQVNEALLQEALQKAKAEKEAAVRQALDNAEKKTAVQLSQRNIAQAKIAVVAKAATETPARPVGEVWEEAKKAKPPPKPEAKPEIKAATSNIPATVPAKRDADNAEVDDTSSEAAKLRARRERFGNIPGSKVASSNVGQHPSAPAEEEASAPNPEATPFVPSSDVGSTNRGQTSAIPAPAARGRGNARPMGGISIQGAAARGGGTSGIARGNFGGNNRGGLKRQHEGGGGGDGKRARGGGPNA